MTENTENSKVEENEKIDYDALLASAGELGIYQKLLFILSGPFYFFAVFAYFTQMFMTEVPPNHWCWIPELENLTDIERRLLAIPSDESAKFQYSQCSQYEANWTEVLLTGQKRNNSWTVQPCSHGWEYNKTEIPYPTISTELGWVCQRDSYQASAQSIFFVGSIVGGFLIGWIGDRFGRIAGTISSCLFGCVAGVASIFCTSFIEFGICRFIMGISYDNCMIMFYLLVLEYVAPRYRTVFANVPIAIFFTSSCCALPWIALACGDWRLLSLVTSLPMCLSVFIPLIVSESPRWLLSKGRVDEAIDNIVKVGKINKSDVPKDLIERFRTSMQSEKKIKQKTSILDIFRTKTVGKMFISMCLQYMCAMMVFDSLVRSVGQLKFDFFMSFTLVSLTECPSLILLTLLLDRTGRKWLSFSSMLISAIFCFLIPFIQPDIASVICAMIARFFVNISANTAMQWFAEGLPTCVRGTSLSMIHVCGYVATVISPFVVYLEKFKTWLPLVLVGIFGLCGAALALFIPETAGKEMPQTFDDADHLIRNKRFFDIPFLEKKDIQKNGKVNNSFQLD